VESFLGTLEASGIAQGLRYSRWGYAAVNTAHVFGIALLVGAILTLDLRLLGLWPRVPRAGLVRVLVPVAAAGLAIAAAMGVLLFSTRAREYADLGIFQAKLVLVATGTAAALFLHARFGFRLEDAGDARLRAHAVRSMLCWVGALICGRLIAFAAG